MKRNVILFAALALATACTPLRLYYQEGMPVDRLNRDEANCNIEAIKAVPVDNRTRLVLGTQRPRTICDGAGNCHTIWAQVTPDRWETYDANEGVRGSYVGNCMITKGYQRVSLPACPDGVVRSTELAATRVLPPITGKSCAIRLKSGNWQVVTPPG